MAQILRGGIDLVRIWFVDYSDPRTDSWLLVNTPLPIIALTALYIYGSLSLGPRLMANRKPFDPRTAIICYNVFQVIGNAVLFWKSLSASYLRDDFDLLCELISPPSDDGVWGMRVVYCGFGYMLLKLADYMDTLFFVLRKQNGHISFLHVYHHAMMGIVGYMGVRFIPGGNGAVLVLANTLVHVCMYTYYLLSAMESTRDVAQRWKKHMTQVQLIQFVFIGSHYLQAYMSPTCKFPRILSILLMLQNTFMALMFLDFYVRTYWRQRRPAGKVPVSHGNEAVAEKSNGHASHKATNGSTQPLNGIKSK